MSPSQNTSLRALRDLALVTAAGVAAASIWAAGLPETAEAHLVDAQLWQEEVVGAQPRQWPADGWYRLAPTGRGIEVSRVRAEPGAAPPADALFFRMPGAQLREGFRPAHTLPTALQKPRLDQDYELTLGATRFTLRVEESAKGMQYVIGYGEQTYTYVLGPFDARSTAIRAIADLDGDARPDFLVDVDEEATYLLLSTQARPGPNLPTAELWAKGC